MEQLLPNQLEDNMEEPMESALFDTSSAEEHTGDGSKGKRCQEKVKTIDSITPGKRSGAATTVKRNIGKGKQANADNQRDGADI